jgi:hypothetical protein
VDLFGRGEGAEVQRERASDQNSTHKASSVSVSQKHPIVRHFTR